MNLIRGTINRIIFNIFIRPRLKKCGKHTLFEMNYEVEGKQYITVGSNVRTKARLHIAAIDSHGNAKYSPQIIIGNDVSINYDVHIAAINKVYIGDGSLIASKVYISDHFHGNTSLSSMKIPPSKRMLESKGPIIIGKNVWIGEGVCVLPNVTIGDNCIIGANAVVTKDIPPFSVAAGVPAKIIECYN